jgi:protein TonB
MPTDLLPTRSEAPVEERVSSGFAMALFGHLGVVLVILAGTWISHRLNPHWGEPDPTVGSIQASMVNSLPLPNTQHFKENQVLTSEKPSVAPTPPPPTPTPIPRAIAEKPKSEPPPKRDEVLIPSKKAEPRKPRPEPPQPPQPVAPRRVAPPPTPTPKATTGETAGVQIPQSNSQLKNGTASLTVADRAFGDRYAYYIRLVAQKCNESKAQDNDPPSAKGKSVIIRFVIDRDGTPIDVQVNSRSGSPDLDFDTVHAIQRVDSFGPLPAGNQLIITYVYTAH